MTTPEPNEADKERAREILNAIAADSMLSQARDYQSFLAISLRNHRLASQPQPAPAGESAEKLYQVNFDLRKELTHWKASALAAESRITELNGTVKAYVDGLTKESELVKEWKIRAEVAEQANRNLSNLVLNPCAAPQALPPDDQANS